MKEEIIKKIKDAIEGHLYEKIVIGLRADNYKYAEGEELYCSTHQTPDGEEIELDGTSVVPLYQGAVGRYDVDDVIEEIENDWDYIVSIVKKYPGKYITIAIATSYELGWDEWGSRQELVIIDGVCITQLDI